MNKHDKDYDTTLARMVGNMLAGDPHSWLIPEGGKIQLAIAAAKLVRAELRKEQAGG